MSPVSSLYVLACWAYLPIKLSFCTSACTLSLCWSHSNTSSTVKTSLFSRNFRFQLYLCAKSYASAPPATSSNRPARWARNSALALQYGVTGNPAQGCTFGSPPPPHAQIAPKWCKKGEGGCNLGCAVSYPVNAKGGRLYEGEKCYTPTATPREPHVTVAEGGKVAVSRD